jgi:hypothetical protein
MAESLSDVFWRLVAKGWTSDQIGLHPDYIAAYRREHPAGHDCLRCITEARDGE